jgi:hypothetical protein
MIIASHDLMIFFLKAWVGRIMIQFYVMEELSWVLNSFQTNRTTSVMKLHIHVHCPKLDLVSGT